MQNESHIPNYIFVGGSPRSGTTLLQNMLDSHPAIVGGPEFLHLPDIIRLRKSMQPTLAKGWLEAYCSREEADEHIKQMIDKFLLPIAKGNTVSYISEKTPDNINVFGDIAELYPEAYFIQIVRDPRAVIASMLKVGQRAKRMGQRTQPFTRNLIDAVAYLKRCYQKGLDFQSGNDRKLLTIHYEELVNDPERLTRRITEFLKLPWDEGMLRPDKFSHAGEKAITNDIWYTKETYNRRPTRDEVDKWKKDLTIIQQVVIYFCFRNNTALTGLGYRLDRTFGSRVAERLAWFAGGIFYSVHRVKSKIGSYISKPVSGFFRLTQ